MSAELVSAWVTPTIVIALFGFLYKELSGIKERLAKLEGLFEGFTKREA